MFNKNTISILRNIQPAAELDYYLQFTGNGYIQINDLTPFLVHNEDFYFEMQFKIDEFPRTGFKYLMNSCYNVEDNKIAIAIDETHLYVHQVNQEGQKTELNINFSDTQEWHTIKVTNDAGSLSAILDKDSLTINEEPLLSLPAIEGFRIASDSSSQNGLVGNVDNILLTDLRDPIAQYLLNTGEGEIAYDSINQYDGVVYNGSWQMS